MLAGSACAPPEQAVPVSTEAEATTQLPVPFDSVSVDNLRAAALTALDWRAGDTLAIEIEDSLRVFAGRLFSPDLRHLYVQIDDRGRNSSFEVVSAVFGLDGWRLSSGPLLIERSAVMNYVSDTLRDANGDGFRDYIVRSYSSSGCCRRDAHRVRLFDPTSGGFTESFELMNPTYYPAERIVRGVEYGHPGEIPLYKAQFMRLGEPERLECIFRVRDEPRRYIRGGCGQGGYRPEGDTLDALPSEYNNVEALSWFMLDP